MFMKGYLCLLWFLFIKLIKVSSLPGGLHKRECIESITLCVCVCVWMCVRVCVCVCMCVFWAHSLFHFQVQDKHHSLVRVRFRQAGRMLIHYGFLSASEKIRL